jgi:predicted membrane-bound mannosyltransferase
VLISVAGAIVATFLWLTRRVAPMALMALVLLAGSAQLGWQAYRLNFPSYYGQRKLSLYCDQRNPYVYSHPGLKMYELVERIEGLAKVHPKGREMRINVFTKDIWPIPWYLRSFSNIGYWPDVDSAVRQGVAEGVNAQTMINAPVIITSTELEPAVAEQLKGSYANPDFFGLRPHVLLIVHVQSDLWEAFLKIPAMK